MPVQLLALDNEGLPTEYLSFYLSHERSCPALVTSYAVLLAITYDNCDLSHPGSSQGVAAFCGQDSLSMTA